MQPRLTKITIHRAGVQVSAEPSVVTYCINYFVINLSVFLFNLGWVMTTISVAKVAKAMLADAENYTRSRKNEGTQQETPSAVTYGNAEILGLLSSN